MNAPAVSPLPFFGQANGKNSAPAHQPTPTADSVKFPQASRNLAAERLSETRRSAYLRHQGRLWTRNSTATWISDRGEAVLAWLRRSGHPTPAHGPSHRLGHWLKVTHPALFTLIHQKLAAPRSETARAALHVGDVIP